MRRHRMGMSIQASYRRETSSMLLRLDVGVYTADRAQPVILVEAT